MPQWRPSGFKRCPIVTVTSERHGRMEGPKNNQRLATYIDVVLACGETRRVFSAYAYEGGRVNCDRCKYNGHAPACSTSKEGNREDDCNQAAR